MSLTSCINCFQSHYKEGKAPAEETTIHRIRITLTSRNVKSLEKGESFRPSSLPFWLTLGSLWNRKR